MRPLFAALALALLVATAAAAQRAWNPELGIQGGFARVKPAGTRASDQVDLVDLPGFGLAPGLPGYGTLFAVIPLRGKVAIEPAISMLQFSLGGVIGGTGVHLGLRGDVAVTRGLYAAAGGTLGYSESGGGHDEQLGLQAALGYRMHLSSRLNARVEALANTLRQTARLRPATVYAVLFGLSARLK